MRNTRTVASADKGIEYIGQELGYPEGLYYVAGATGLLTGAGANGEIFQFRNPDASKILIVLEIIAHGELLTAYTTPQENYLELIKATGWTIDGTGGTAMAGSKKHSALPASVVASGNARIATTAALGAGTKNLDGQSMGSVPLYEANTALTYSRTPIEFDNPAMSPKDPLVILAQNEGIVLRQPIAMGAVGVHRVHIRVAYREVG